MGKRRNTSTKKITSTQPESKRHRQDMKQSDSSSLSIDSLPPDVLIKIFGYLQSRERLALERVSQHWRFIAQKSWQTVHKLNISTPYDSNQEDKIYLALNDEAFALSTKESQRVLRKIFSLCGCFVKKIGLSGKVGISAYSLVRSNCPNLRTLKLNRFGAYASVKILGPIFKKCPQLKRLSIDSCDSTVISVLKQLPIEKLENLKILTMNSNCGALEIISFVEKLQSLKGFKFPIFAPLMRAVGMKIHLNFPFSLRAADRKFNSSELFHMLDLTNLEDIYLPGLTINDDFLVRLAANCKNLKYLHIEDIAEIAERGLSAVSTLPNLISLKVAGSDAVTDEILPKFVKIKRIDCANCECLTKSGCISLIRNSEALEELIISYEKGETEEFLEKAVEIVETRSVKKVLTIGVYFGLDDSLADGVISEFDDRSEYLDVYVDEL